MPKLTIRRGDTLDREIELSDRDLRIGRGEQNDVVLTDPEKSVSRSHAELRYRNGVYILLDLNSQNGLWVRGRKEKEITLEPDVPVTIGTYTLSLASAATVVSGPMVPAAIVLPVNQPDTAGAGDALGPAERPTNTPRPRATPAPAGTQTRTTSAVPSRGLVAALAGMPRPMLFSGIALLVVLIVALGWSLAPSNNSSGAPQQGAVVTPTPSGKELRDLHVAAAKTLLEKNDYDGAIKELDEALAALPDDVEAVELKAKATEAKEQPAANSPGPLPPDAGTAAAISSPTPPAANPSAAANTSSAAARGARGAEAGSPPPPLSIGCRPGELRADCAVRDREVADRYQRATNALAAGAFDAAIAQLTDLNRDEPGYKDVTLLIARARERLHAAAQDALDAGAKAEGGGDLIGALQQYGRASQIDKSTAVVAEESVKRVRARMKTEGTDAFTRAKQYDAFGRVADAVPLFERAIRYLPDDDPNKKYARERLDALRGRQ